MCNVKRGVKKLKQKLKCSVRLFLIRVWLNFVRAFTELLLFLQKWMKWRQMQAVMLFCVCCWYLPHEFLFDTSTRHCCLVLTQQHLQIKTQVMECLDPKTQLLSCLISLSPLLICFRHLWSKVRLVYLVGQKQVNWTYSCSDLIYFTHKWVADLPLDYTMFLLMMNDGFFK